MAPRWHVQIVITLRRQPGNQDLVDYTIRKVAWRAPIKGQTKTQTRDDLSNEGTFVCKKEIHDVLVVIHELGRAVDVHASARDGRPGTPGRERSGFENVPLPLEGLSEPPQQPPGADPAPDPS